MTGERRVVYWCIALAVLIALIVLLREILLPFVLGMAIAYFLDPAADFLERRRLSRTLAATVLTVVFLLSVIVALLLLAPLIQAQIVSFIGRIPAYVDMLRGSAQELLALIQARLAPEDVARLREAAGGIAGDTVRWLGGLFSGLWRGGLAVLNLLSLVVITPVVTFYLLRDWDRIVARIDTWLPRAHAETIREQVREIDKRLAAFVRGQAIVCLGLGAFYGIALTLAGLEFGLVIGLATGLISFVPYVGMLVGLLTSVGLAFAQFDDWTRIAIVAAIFIVGQIAEGNFITPKLVGDRVGLHPVWMIFALLAGGALFGFLGLLLAVPAAAAIGVLTRFGLQRYMASELYADGDGDRAG